MAGAYPNQWGLFDSELNPVFEVDSCLEVGYGLDFKTSNFPVEKGGFASYNKVAEPFKARVRLAVGGDGDRIKAFVDALDAAVASTDLYSVVTPEKVYLKATLERVSYRRSARSGANLIAADLELLQVREVDPVYVNVAIPAAKAKSSSSASKVNTGKQQPQDPSDPAFSDLTPQQAIELGIQHGRGPA